MNSVQLSKFLRKLMIDFANEMNVDELANNSANLLIAKQHVQQFADFLVNKGLVARHVYEKMIKNLPK